MEVVVLHTKSSTTDDNGSLLRSVCKSRPISGIVLEGLCAGHRGQANGDTVIAIDQRWYSETPNNYPLLTYDNGSLPIPVDCLEKGTSGGWLIVSNGRFFTDADRDILCGQLAMCSADIAAVNVDPALLSRYEKVKITSKGHVAGFRRLYSDMVLAAPFPQDWPCHLFISLDAIDRILVNGTLPLSFDELVRRCKSGAMNCRSLSVAGRSLDLETKTGLLEFLAGRIRSRRSSVDRKSSALADHTNNCTISAGARLFGEVILGNNVHIGDNAMVVGPAIICDDVVVKKGAVVRTSIVGPGLSIPGDSFLQERVLVGPDSQDILSSCAANAGTGQPDKVNLSFAPDSVKESTFRTWPRLSYAGFGKRIADIIGSAIILILFLPVFPIIAIAIKLSSPGPVFYKARRQGLHGKKFDCLKFRSMMVNADTMQDKLHAVNQVDGPQFKMHNDPRINVVGKFLRDTFIDEIPQFVNVLLGQMSVVGPRPSPDKENSLCPSWRDARLSVRPGITGLWQICRTRQPMKDFQEWIHYDVKYVRDLSLKKDLWVCRQTAMKLIKTFFDQF